MSDTSAETAAAVTGVLVSTQPQDGNRLYDGPGNVLAEPTTIHLGSTPLWVGGIEVEGGVLVAAVLADGSVEARTIVGRRILETKAISLLDDPTHTVTFEFTPDLVRARPHLTDSQVGYFAVDHGGIAVTRDHLTSLHPLDPLPDGKPVVDPDRGYVATLTGPTDRYPHGILGDDLEAAGLTIIDSLADEVLAEIEFPDGLVAEAASAMWIVGSEVLVTLSDSQAGARLALYRPDGMLLATGADIGRGGRWRHQIGAASIGPNGEYEIVSVKTPHIGGVVEFWRVGGDSFERLAEVGGLTSHGIGSRNLDWAAIADADGDGALEVVGPAQDRRSLLLVERTSSGAAIGDAAPLPDRLTTNLGFIEGPGRLWVIAGTADGTLLVWPPAG